jgi:hypothetical protein
LQVAQIAALNKAGHRLDRYEPLAGPSLWLNGWVRFKSGRTLLFTVLVRISVCFATFLFLVAGPALVDEAVALAKAVCSASSDVVFFCLLPTVHGSTSQHVVVRHRRHMEDLLMAFHSSICC